MHDISVHACPRLGVWCSNLLTWYWHMVGILHQWWCLGQHNLIQAIGLSWTSRCRPMFWGKWVTHRKSRTSLILGKSPMGRPSWSMMIRWRNGEYLFSFWESPHMPIAHWQHVCSNTRKKALFLVWTHPLPTNHWPLTHTPRILTLAFFCRHTSTSCRVLAPRVCCGLWFWCKVGNGLGGPYHCNCPGQLCCPCVLEHPTPLIHLYPISSFGNCQGWIKLDRSPKALKKMLKGTNNMQKEKSTL